MIVAQTAESVGGINGGAGFAALGSHDLPYLTADIPGIGGTIKSRPEDFFVEELPLYEPSGEGTHVYVQIEKTGITTQDAVHWIANALGKRDRDIGVAGRKDAHAVTRQTISVEHVDPDDVLRMSIQGVRVVRVDRHGNKLRVGHLRGNRFIVKVRDVPPHAMTSARSTIDDLARRGMANYFGPQRFGARGDNGLIGRAALLGDHAEAVAQLLGRPDATDTGPVLEARRFFDRGQFDEAARAWPRGSAVQRRVAGAMARTRGNPRRAWNTVDHNMRLFYLNAFQAELFNRVLADRIQRIDLLEIGDLAWKHANGACFHVADAVVEQPRCAAIEISPTGPLFGKRMTAALGDPGEREARVLADAGIMAVHLSDRNAADMNGARRPLRVPVGDIGLEHGHDDAGDFVRLTFELPAGGYATSLLREICKNEEAASETT
ncbi:MAG: tRNA pseudouridine(13) synthase TruD [Phycisphaerales bacterium]|nr:tRNA pseudouridine(13) synthase TruD [Phycisphaerales bacterium]